MAIRIRPPRKWSHKHIIVVVFIGTLVVIATAAAISISLSPAHIFFEIEKPRFVEVNDTKYYNFTLVAYNNSTRMALLYGALSAEIWSETAWVPAVVDPSALQGKWSPPGNPTRMNVSAEYWQSEQQASPPPPPAGANSGGATSGGTDDDGLKWLHDCTVLVTARVRFKYGRIRTRSYNVRASCPKVNFHNDTTVKCG